MNQQIIKHINNMEWSYAWYAKNLIVFQWSALKNIFITYHFDSVSKEWRTILVKYARTLKDQLKDPNEVKLIIPPFEEGPIDGLHKVFGYECMKCKKLLPQLSSMKLHYRLHRWTQRKGDM